MKYFTIFLVLSGFIGSAFAQNIVDTQDYTWLPMCPKESKAECDKSSLFPDAISKPFAQSDLVAIGTIVQKENQEQNSIQYSINVDFYLKNYQPFDLITATLNNAADPKSSLDLHYYNSPVFNEGDLVFVYLERSDGTYNLLPQSFALDKHDTRGPPPIILLTYTPNKDNFEQGDEILVSGEVRKMELVKGMKDGKKIDVKLTILDDNKEMIFSKLIDIDIDGNYSYILDTSIIPPGEYELEINYDSMTYSPEITINFNSKYWTPLKQFNFGIPASEIQCKEGLNLALKSSDESPICLIPETKEILIERGWAKSV